MNQILLKQNLTTLFDLFCVNEKGCKAIVETFGDMQQTYENAGEFQAGAIVSEYRNRAFRKGNSFMLRDPAYQLKQAQDAFVGGFKI